MHEIHIHSHTTAGDLQINLPLMLHPFRNGKRSQTLFDLHLCDHVLRVILLVQFPFFRTVTRINPCVRIRFRGLTRHRKQPDQILADLHFLLVGWQAQRCTCSLQACSISGVQAVKHRASPLIWDHGSAHPLGQSTDLKVGIVRVFGVPLIK